MRRATPPPLAPDDLNRHQASLNSGMPDIAIEKIIGDIHRKKEEAETKKIAAKFNLPYLNLVNYQPEANIVDIIPKELVESGHIFAFKKIGGEVYLAISDVTHPKTLEALETIQEQYHDYKFIPVLVSKFSMKYLSSIYDIFAPRIIKNTDELDITPDKQHTSTEIFQEIQQNPAELATTPVSELLNIVFSGATQFEASDIHIEPESDHIQVRFRVDSVLQDIITLPSDKLDGLINRIKLLSKLKLNIRESAQDGRFSFTAGDTNYDVRVSILPSAYGESAVMRLLPQKGKFLSLEQLGLVGHNAEIIDWAIQQPDGLLLNTGPTGAGKTTTLYAILDKINGPGKKIITIEDPIEYRIKGITQSQVNPEENYTFSSGLRAILRQDPDIILVGEIRDTDTANIAVNASLTGHLVLSTLHTNDAAGAIPRLADLGLKPTYFIEAVLAVIAQRLVRRVCQDCAETYTPSETEIAEITAEMNNLPPQYPKPEIPPQLKRYNPETSSHKKCPTCNGLGYKGIIGIFEIMRVNEDIIKAVLSSATIGDIKKLAMTNGMVTLKQDGIIKMLNGITTLEEINRITGQDDPTAR
ncbi:GspE/PulE family protein [Patescibacteria group bacterium]|nr:GspE/PulE family protein [Patescibacteria group bacterium]